MIKSTRLIKYNLQSCFCFKISDSMSTVVKEFRAVNNFHKSAHGEMFQDSEEEIGNFYTFLKVDDWLIYLHKLMQKYAFMPWFFIRHLISIL